MPIIVDGSAETNRSGSSAAFNSFFAALGRSGLPIVPLVDVGATQTYGMAVSNALNQFASGLALRVPLHQLQTAPGWLAAFGESPASTDLLIDCGHIADINPGLLTPVVLNALGGATLTGWRSVTLSASAAPKDASSLNTGPNLIPRRDWQLWSATSGQFPPIHFGDYGIAHRDLTEPPGYAMANATVTPRYTLDNEWLIRKGRSQRGPQGQPMAAQYHGHAQALVRHPNFGGIGGCWADAEIAQIAARGGVGRSGGRKTWVSLGLNRHISLVCDRLP